MHIKRLRLRISAENAEAGRAFAKEFTEALAARSEGLPSAHIGALSLRLHDAGDPAASARAVAARLNIRRTDPDRDA